MWKYNRIERWEIVFKIFKMEKIDDDWTATDVLKRVLIFRRVKLFELSFYFLFLHGETAEPNRFSFGQRNHDRTRVSPTCKGASGLRRGDRKPREGENRSIETRFRSLFLRIDWKEVER